MVTAPDLQHVDVRPVQTRTLRVLASGAVLGGLAVAGSVAAGSLIAADVSGSEAMAGLAQTSGVLGAAVLALPLARIALRHGRRAALSTGYGIGAAGAVVVVIAAVLRSLPMILLGTFLVGVASASSYQARYAATDLAEEQHRARDLSWVVWAGTIGAVLGPNLLNASGALGESLGLPRLAGPYVVGAVLLGATAAVLITWLRPDPYRLALARRSSPTSTMLHPTLRQGLEHVRTRPRAMLGIAAISLGHVVMVMVMVMTPVHMAHVDVSLQFIGLVISVHVAGMYAFSPVVGWLVDRIGRIQVVILGVGILTAACVVSGLAPGDDVPMLGVGLFLLGLGWSCTLIAGSTIVTDEVAANERPAVQGLSDLSMNASAAIGGAVAGVVVMVASYGALCAVALLPVALLGVLTAIPACRAHSNTRSI